uniref:CLAVATA3/ESR (CLE)-related protein n=1 Tax=Meloidogyne floridensis TaxID=298350 RepID=A0A915P5G3_9BILA
MKSTTFQFIFLLIIGIQLICTLNNVDGANEQKINVDKIKGNNNGDGGSLLNEDVDYKDPNKKPPDHNP